MLYMRGRAGQLLLALAFLAVGLARKLRHDQTKFGLPSAAHDEADDQTAMVAWQAARKRQAELEGTVTIGAAASGLAPCTNGIATAGGVSYPCNKVGEGA